MAGWLPQEVHGIVSGAGSVCRGGTKRVDTPLFYRDARTKAIAGHVNTIRTELAVVQQGLALTCCTGDDGEACQDTIQATKHHSLQKISLIAV